MLVCSFNIKMKILLLISVLLIFVYLADAAKKNKGCIVNGKTYKPNKIVLRKKKNCVKLKCMEETGGKKTKYRVRTVPYPNCECNTIPCPGPETCTLDNSPVCGSDGSLYSNECFLNVAACFNKKLKKAPNPKSCQVCPNKCPTNYLPICGNDGVLYDNICELQAVACTTSGLAEATDPSTCQAICPDFCSTDYNPVCASNGMAFSNPCEFQRYVCKVDSSVTLSLDPSICGDLCPTCPTQADPVCGSDGVTYLNECSLKSVAKPCGKQDISVSYTRPCSRDCYDVVCNNDYEPVCGSDGVLYTNLCQFYQEICTNPALKEADDPSTCTFACPACLPLYAPVCGTNGVTYDNECYLLSVARPCGTVDVQVASLGLCADDCTSTICTTEFDPVCGSDGSEYSNLCDLKNAICADPTLTEASDPSACTTGSGRHRRSRILGNLAKREIGSDPETKTETETGEEVNKDEGLQQPEGKLTVTVKDLAKGNELNPVSPANVIMVKTPPKLPIEPRSHLPECTFNGKKYDQRDTIKKLNSYCAELRCGKKKGQAALKLSPLRVSYGQQCKCVKTP
ncbi:hypothetical protein SK128_013060 [Halocaridina rubra]|uniref:Kazal-like domain-containing protein n=1 Tax=Halocaridina rubra TaxID=373956 RepID=A0AAN8WEU2_HALRR